MSERIRAILARHGRLAVPVAQLGDGDDLYAAGLDSLASVKVMLALEAAYDVEIPPERLTRASFASIAALARLMAQAAVSA